MRDSVLSFEHWRRKFGYAFRGFATGVRGESSFYVHFTFAAAVIVAGAAFRVASAEWCALVVAITGVLAAEMFNSSLERLAKAVTRERDENIQAALDIGSAAVLVAAGGAVIVGVIVFGPRLVGLI